MQAYHACHQMFLEQINEPWLWNILEQFWHRYHTMTFPWTDGFYKNMCSLFKKKKCQEKSKPKITQPRANNGKAFGNKMFHEGDSFGTTSVQGVVMKYSIFKVWHKLRFLPGVLSFLLERKILGHYWQLENMFVWTWNEVLEILTWKRNLSGPWLVKSIFYAVCSGVSTPPLMSYIWNSSLNPVFLISGAMFSMLCLDFSSWGKLLLAGFWRTSEFHALTQILSSSLRFSPVTSSAARELGSLGSIASSRPVVDDSALLNNVTCLITWVFLYHDYVSCLDC